MAVKYRWHAESPKACYKCTRWHGVIFDSANALPELPVHPNCSCYVEVFDTSFEEISQLAHEIRGLIPKAQEDAMSLKTLLGIDILRGLYSDLNTCILALEQVVGTANIFWRNFLDMRNANFRGADKYFHSKANAQAAQLGRVGEETAKFVSEMREFTDYYKYLSKDVILLRSMTHMELKKDIASDKAANVFGRKMGRTHPASKIEAFIEKYRPRGLDRKY